MSTDTNRGLVYEALLDCIDEDVPVTDETIKGWSRAVTEYLDRKGYVVQHKRRR
jgi:hypothetical protein